MNNINIRLLIVAVLMSITFVVSMASIPMTFKLLAWAIITPPPALALPLVGVLAAAAVFWVLGISAVMQRLSEGFVRIWKGEK